MREGEAVPRRLRGGVATRHFSFALPCARAALVLFVLLGAKSGWCEPRRLSLAEATRLARDNPMARAALHQHRATSAQAAEARGARFPRLSLIGFLAPSPEINCDNPECTRTSPVNVAPSVEGVFGGARLEVLQPLYTFGKIDAAVEAGESATAMTRAQADGVQDDLALETARVYYGVALARELSRMLEDGARRIDDGLKTLEDRLRAGDPEVTVQDRLRLATFQTEVSLRSSEAREKERTALEGLRGLVGERDADIAEGAFEAVPYTLADVDVYVRHASGASPDLRAARHGISALDHKSDLERARWWPDIALLGAVGFARAQGVDDPPSAFANDPFNNVRAEVAAVVRWTVEPAMQAARVQRAEEEHARARSLGEVAERAVEFAVRDAHNRAREARERLEVAKKGERSARGWVTSVMQADAVGTASARDLADAFLAYFTLHTRVLQSTYEWNLALASLERAAGGLPPSPAAPEERSQP